MANERAEILELACGGPGNVTRYLLDKCPGWKILGTDDLVITATKKY